MRLADQRKRLNRRYGMMWGGFGTALVTYGFTAVFGTTATFFNRFGTWYLVPVVGPFVAAQDAVFPGWAITSGVLQLGGVVLGSVGAGLWVTEKKRLQATAMRLEGGGGVQLRLEF